VHDMNALGPMLGHAAHLARERMDARLCRYDVTPAQTHVILYLHSLGGTVTQGDMTLFLKVRPSTANGILDRLTEKGLVTRSVSKRDARQRLISLTDKGCAQVEQFHASFAEAENILSAGFTAEESEQLRALLGRVIHNLEEDRKTC